MKILLVVVLIFSSLSTVAMTKDDWALGAMIGNPTGINGKYWLGDRQAVDGGVGISPGKSSNVSLHSDYLLHQPSAFYFNDEYPLDFYYGLGARMEFGKDIELGVRIPFGLVHNITEQRADIFVEVAPILDIISRFGLELHLLAGGRYYF
jgi:hypothetical protein